MTKPTSHPKTIEVQYERFDGALRLLTVMQAFQALRYMMQEFENNDQTLIGSPHLMAQMDLMEYCLRDVMDVFE